MTLTDITVVALCGVTCSGKTSLARLLAEHFRNKTIIASARHMSGDNDNPSDIPIKDMINTDIVVMDDYFLPENDSRHKVVAELNHINWELMTSLDTDKMVEDLTSGIERLKSSGYGIGLFIVEGFLVLNCERLKSLCDIKFFVDIDYTTCYSRRVNRVYDPPDVPGYFEKVVWPESQKNRESVFKSTADIEILDGCLPLQLNLNKMEETICKHWSKS